MMVILCNLYSRDIREKNVIYNKRGKNTYLLRRKSFTVEDVVPKQCERSHLHNVCSALTLCCVDIVYGVLCYFIKNNQQFLLNQIFIKRTENENSYQFACGSIWCIIWLIRMIEMVLLSNNQVMFKARFKRCTLTLQHRGFLMYVLHGTRVAKTGVYSPCRKPGIITRAYECVILTYCHYLLFNRASRYKGF